MTPSVTAACLIALLVLASEVGGQASGFDRPRRLDAEIAYLTGSWLFPMSETWSLGPELGLGGLEQKTLAPSGDDFTAILHVGGIATLRLSPRANVDIGFRIGWAELRSRACSGCFPRGYGAGTVGLFLGSHRFQGGTRVSMGRASGRAFAAWSPLVARVRF